MIMRESEKLEDSRFHSLFAWALTIFPLSFLFNIFFAWSLLFLVLIFLLPKAIKLVWRFYKRKNLVDHSTNPLSYATRPLILIYVSGSSGVAYQINQWIPVLESLDLPFLIMIRSRIVYHSMPPTKIPVVFAKGINHVGDVLENWGVKTVLYPANHRTNIQALRYSNLNHFFINHGESDKVVNQSQLMKVYDKLLLAGTMAHKRLVKAGVEIDETKIEYVGRPQTELLLNKKLKGKQPIKRILYAPTWEGYVKKANYSSVGAIGIHLLSDLASTGRYEIVFKPHPYTGLVSAETKRAEKAIYKLCKENNIDVIDGDTASIHECMNNSDILITDISSVLSEYLSTEKPIILCVNNWLSAIDIDDEFPTSAAAYRLYKDTDPVLLLDEIDRNDPMGVVREAVRKDVFGDFKKNGSLLKFQRVLEGSL